MAPLDLIFAGCLLLFSVSLVRRFLFSRKARLSLPPGPRGLPFLGNVFEIPKPECWAEKFHEWSIEYNSELIHFNVLGSSTIVIDSYKAAHDLIDQRSSTYASRPTMTMMCDLTGFDWHVGFMPYGNKWREHRKLLHQYFETSRQLKYRPASLESARVLLHGFLEKPEDFMEHIRLLTGSFILSISYGINVKSSDDPHIALAERGMYAMGQVGFGYLVDFFPSLKHTPSWFPGGHFKTQANEWRKDATDMANVPFEMVKSWMSQGDASPSIASDLLSKIPDDSVDTDKEELRIKNVLASAYAVGADTTVSPISTFILAMVMYPEVQKRAQAAVDEVLSGHRLPDFSDFGTIPYVDALMRELFRWNPAVPLGVAYSVITDDVYNGYHIPAGSTVYVNIWAMLQNEEIYGPEPTIFKPERFLVDGHLNENVKYPSETFGFGRRVCPGMTTAKELIWITITSILASFDIEKAIGPDGSPIEPSGEFSSGFISHPLPFHCVIKPRSSEAASLIRSTHLDTTF